MDRNSAFGRIMRKVVPGRTVSYKKPAKRKSASGYKRRANPSGYKVPKTPKTSGRGWK